MKLKLFCLLTIAVSLSSCASNVQIVKRMESRNMACSTKDVTVTELDPYFAGVSRYQATGCGNTHNYACGKWDNLVMAALGSINLDPRPCIRERR